MPLPPEDPEARRHARIGFPARAAGWRFVLGTLFFGTALVASACGDNGTSPGSSASADTVSSTRSGETPGSTHSRTGSGTSGRSTDPHHGGSGTPETGTPPVTGGPSSSDPPVTQSPPATPDPWPTDPWSDPGTFTDPGLSGWGLDVAPEPGSVTLPPIPRALTPMPVRRGIHVRWWPVEGAEGYVLYRGPRPGSTPERATRIELSDPFYHDVDARPGQTWYYAVAAVLDGVEGEVSGEIAGVAVNTIPPRQLRVTMDPADLHLLYTRNRYSDDGLPAEVRVIPDNDTIEVEGIRFRGAGSRRYPKLGFNIRLHNRPHFNFGSAYRDGGNRILLNAMWTDPTAMRDAIGFDAYTTLGLPAPATQYADLYLNGVYEGFYVLFERIDREALRGWNLNRRRGGMSLVRDNLKSNRRRWDLEDNRSTFGVDLDAMFATDAERLAFLHDTWEWRGEQEDHDWEGILELVRWVNGSEPGPTFAAELRRRFHYQDLVTVFALHGLFQDTDSLDADYWLYRDEDGDNRWRIIPWDVNLVLGGGWHGDFLGSNDFLRYDYILVNPATNPLINLFMDTPELWADLEAHLRDLMENHIHRGWIEEQIARLLPRVALGLEPREDGNSFIMQPKQHHGDVGYLPHHLEQIAEFMDLRHAWILKEIDRRNNQRTGDTRRVLDQGIALEAGERHCLTDRVGHTYLCLQPRRRWNGSASLALVEDERLDGVMWRYLVQLSTPFDGTVTLFYHNSPRRNWVAEEHWANNQWRLEMVVTHVDGTAERLRTRVNPFANMVLGEARLEPGTYTFTLQHGPGPVFPLDGHEP